MKTNLFILDENRQPVGVESNTEGICQWGKWYEQTEKRRVAATQVGAARISTVFLGIDHGFGDEGPVLWETMVFGGPFDQETDRCGGSWQDAEAMHARMVAKVSETEKKGM